LPVEIPNVTSNLTNSTGNSNNDFEIPLKWLTILAGILGVLGFIIYYFNNRQEPEAKRLTYNCAYCGERFRDNSPQPFVGDPDRTWTDVVRLDAVVHTQMTGHNQFILHDTGKRYST
jgi:hypothetical protein